MEEIYLNEIGDDGVVKGEEKVEKGRERNREHAKRTRIKKKAVLDEMKGKLLDLQNEVNFVNITVDICFCKVNSICEINPLIFDQS